MSSSEDVLAQTDTDTGVAGPAQVDKDLSSSSSSSDDSEELHAATSKGKTPAKQFRKKTSGSKAGISPAVQAKHVTKAAKKAKSVLRLDCRIFVPWSQLEKLVPPAEKRKFPSNTKKGHLFYGVYKGHPDDNEKACCLEIEVGQHRVDVISGRARFQVVQPGQEESPISARQKAIDDKEVSSRHKKNVCLHTHIL